MTIYNTPILTPFLRFISIAGYRLFRWRLQNHIDPFPRKCVIAAVPHTSNWDFFLFLAAVFYYRLSLSVMIKHTVFFWPLGVVLRYCGAIPIDRRKVNARVRDVAAHFAARDEFILVITPEGTRSAVRDWKSGFYRIAYEAQVPLVLARLDAQNKRVALLEIFPMSGDYKADYPKIRAKFKNASGVKPRNFIP